MQIRCALSPSSLLAAPCLSLAGPVVSNIKPSYTKVDTGIISNRYAKALLRFACEQGDEDKVYAEMAQAAKSFIDVPTLQAAVQNPVLTAEQLAKLLLTAACGEQKPTATLSKFVSLLVSKGRANIMLFVAHAYGTLYRAHKQIVQTKLIVPAPLSKDNVERMRNLLASFTDAKHVEFQVREDPSLLGGFVLEYDTYRMDASVKAQLARIKRQLAAN